MIGSETLTTEASRNAMPEPSTEAASTQRPEKPDSFAKLPQYFSPASLLHAETAATESLGHPYLNQEETMGIQAQPKSHRPSARRAADPPTHVLILAGGDGTRLQEVTRGLTGDDRPKQYCALVGDAPLVVQTERRAALIAPRDQVILSLTRRHEPWYRDLVAPRDPFCVTIQPENRGTAAAVLFGLLRIATRTRAATVVVLPSDHWVSSDSAFMLHVQAAIGIIEAHPHQLVLLGVDPTRPEREFGWIERGESVISSWSGLSRVAGFVEKPSPETAETLFAGNASLWNTMVLVGRLDRLLLLFAQVAPDLVDAFVSVWDELGSDDEPAAIERLRRVHVTPAASELRARVAAIAERARVSRPVRVVQSAAVRVPAVVGWLRPVILLPARAERSTRQGRVELTAQLFSAKRKPLPNGSRMSMQSPPQGAGPTPGR